jgi:hypothetical protein
MSSQSYNGRWRYKQCLYLSLHLSHLKRLCARSVLSEKIEDPEIGHKPQLIDSTLSESVRALNTATDII